MKPIPFRLPLALVVAVAVMAGAAAWLSAPALAARTIRINAGNGGFSIKEITADPGEELEIVLQNVDLATHGIVFELDGGRVETIEPIGLAIEKKLSFAAPMADGRYTYYSQVGDDRANGFEGVLVVGDAAQEGRVIPVEAFNYGYNPAQIVVQPGEMITVEMTSTDGFHDIVFELDGDRVESSERVSAPGMVSVGFTAPTEPGVYVFYCSVGSHREQGMEGVLIVGEPLRVEASNFAFDPDRIEVSPGETVVVELVNVEGTHDIVFELEGGQEARTSRINGGESELLVFTAPSTPGEYDFYCSVGRHREFGMEGVLVVGEAAQQEGRVIPVEAFNYGYNPAQIVVQPGEMITVEMTSTDGFHDIVFELDGERVVSSVRVSAPGMVSVGFTAPTEPGVYVFYCSVGSHREQGMEGVLIVGDGGGGGTPTATEPPPMETPTPTTEPPPARFQVMIDGLDSPHGLWLSDEMPEMLVSEGGTGDPVPGEFTPGNGDGRVLSYEVPDTVPVWGDPEVLLEDMTNSIDPGGGIVGANHAIRHAGGFGQGAGGGVLVAQAGGPGHLRPEEAAKILLVRASGEVVLVADTLAFEEANNPNGETGDEAIDSNPWRLVEGPDGAVYVVDAGANDILKLDPATGQLSTWAIFAPLTADGGQQAIPTGLAFDEDGSAYVSLLGRFAPPDGTEGSGQVRKLVDGNGDGDMLDDGENLLHADGLWLPTDIAFSPSGGLYVTSIGGPGTVSHVPTGDGPVMAEAVVTGVPAVSAMAFLDNGDLLVTETSAPVQGAPNLRPDRIVRIPAAELEPAEPPSGPRIFIPIAERS
jgi:plastocyanin